MSFRMRPAREVEDLNSANLAQERRDVTRQSSAHRGDMQAWLWQTLGLSIEAGR